MKLYLLLLCAVFLQECVAKNRGGKFKRVPQSIKLFKDTLPCAIIDPDVYDFSFPGYDSDFLEILPEDVTPGLYKSWTVCFRMVNPRFGNPSANATILHIRDNSRETQLKIQYEYKSHRLLVFTEKSDPWTIQFRKGDDGQCRHVCLTMDGENDVAYAHFDGGIKNFGETITIDNAGQPALDFTPQKLKGFGYRQVFGAVGKCIDSNGQWFRGIISDLNIFGGFTDIKRIAVLANSATHNKGDILKWSDLRLIYGQVSQVHPSRCLTISDLERECVNPAISSNFMDYMLDVERRQQQVSNALKAFSRSRSSLDRGRGGRSRAGDQYVPTGEEVTGGNQYVNGRSRSQPPVSRGGNYYEGAGQSPASQPQEATLYGQPRIQYTQQRQVPNPNSYYQGNSYASPNSLPQKNYYGPQPYVDGSPNPPVQRQPQSDVEYTGQAYVLPNSQNAYSYAPESATYQQVPPQYAGQGSPQYVGQGGPQYIGQGSPQGSPQYVGQGSPQGSPQYVGQDSPQANPQYIAQGNSQYVNQNIPQGGSQYVGQGAPQASPQYIGQSSPQSNSQYSGQPSQLVGGDSPRPVEGYVSSKTV